MGSRLKARLLLPREKTHVRSEVLGDRQQQPRLKWYWVSLQEERRESAPDPAPCKASIPHGQQVQSKARGGDVIACTPLPDAVVGNTES